MRISGKMDRNYPVNIDVLCVAGGKGQGRKLPVVSESNSKGKNGRIQDRFCLILYAAQK